MKKISKWMIFILVLTALSFIGLIRSGYYYNKSVKDYGPKISDVNGKSAYPSDNSFDTCQNATSYISDLYITLINGIFFVMFVIIFFILYHYAS